MAQLRVLSLGWGVQSFTLAAMSALGDLPKLDVIIHADTSWERQSTYEFETKWLPWLESKGMLVISASSRTSRDNLVRVPAYFHNKAGEVAKLTRTCTSRWKIDVVHQIIRQELLIRGLKKTPGVVEEWLGISWDEAMRASNSPVKYIDHKFPFLEKETRMKRVDCLQWLGRNGFDIPEKSSCTHCVFHNQTTWMAMKANNKEDWNQAVEYDKSLRLKKAAGNLSKEPVYVHRSIKPLDKAVFLPEESGYSQSFLPMDGPGCDTAGYCWD